MRITGEELFFARVVEPLPGEECRVQLDDGRVLAVQVPEHLRGFYRLVPGERVCVSIFRGENPTLTGYLEGPSRIR